MHLCRYPAHIHILKVNPKSRDSVQKGKMWGAENKKGGAQEDEESGGGDEVSLMHICYISHSFLIYNDHLSCAEAENNCTQEAQLSGREEVSLVPVCMFCGSGAWITQKLAVGREEPDKGRAYMNMRGLAVVRRCSAPSSRCFPLPLI